MSLTLICCFSVLDRLGHLVSSTRQHLCAAQRVWLRVLSPSPIPLTLPAGVVASTLVETSGSRDIDQQDLLEEPYSSPPLERIRPQTNHELTKNLL